jgi:hypothetical protein
MPITAPIFCVDPVKFAPQTTLVAVAGSDAGTTTTQVIKDVQFSVDTKTPSHAAYDVAQVMPQFLPSWQLTSKSPDICSVVGNRVTKVTNGTGELRLTGPHGFSKVLSITFSPGFDITYIWTGIVANSASANLSNPILSLLIASKQKNYYSPNYTLGATTVAKNPNCWAAPLNLTGSAISTSLGDENMSYNSGALITPRHWLGVQHWGSGENNMGVGARLRFVGSDGTVHLRTVLRRYLDASKDRIVSLLNSDLPATVTPFKFAAAPMIDSANQRFLGMGWAISQEKNVFPVSFDDFQPDRKSLLASPIIKWESSFNQHVETGHRLNGLSSLFQTGRIGDSGGAVGGYYNNQTYLVSLFTGAIAGYLYSANQAAEINSIIAGLDAAQGISTGYTVGVISFP